MSLFKPFPEEKDWFPVPVPGESVFEGLGIAHHPALPDILRESFGWAPLRVRFLSEGKEEGWLQACRCPSGWFSMPHFSHSGLIIHPFARERAKSWLDWLALALANENQAAGENFVLELSRQELANCPKEVLTKPLIIRNCGLLIPGKDVGKTLSYIDLPEEWPKQEGFFPGDVRRKIRRARSLGLEAISGGTELLEDFYSVYRKNIHALGSFGLPLPFFQRMLLDYHPGLAKVYLIKKGKENIGAAILLAFGEMAENPWFATSREHNQLYPAYLLHESMMEDAWRGGYRLYSFGRSTTGSGVHRFKQQWGGRDVKMLVHGQTKFSVNRFWAKWTPRVIRAMPIGCSRIFDQFIGGKLY